jgi:4-methyl-5(b-hydroxyethyl)-thiazole monophosphate biosynthesis
MANGCEEIEGLTVVDLLRRSGIQIDMLSITDDLQVTGSHDITFLADHRISDVNMEDYDGIILPGGMPGTLNLGASIPVMDTLVEFAKGGKLVGAICAAPSVLGKQGVLEGKDATSYPGFEKEMSGCRYKEDAVVVDGNIITSRGMGTAIDFGLAIVAYLSEQQAADALADKIIYKK